MTRQVLKLRTRYVPDPGPFEGGPEHLMLPLLRWLASALRLGSPIESTDAMYTIMNRLRIPPKPVTDGRNPLWGTIMKWIDEDHARLIAVIEVVLDICMIAYPQLRMLEQILSDGGSIYTATENGIQERVDPVAKQAFTAAIQPKDHASAELSEAWAKAYGQQQDASDAWDHAIKAVEVVLIGAVVPKQDKPTLGHVLRELPATRARSPIESPHHRHLDLGQLGRGMPRLAPAHGSR